jgi:hypothetical protein
MLKAAMRTPKDEGHRCRHGPYEDAELAVASCPAFASEAYTDTLIALAIAVLTGEALAHV